MAELSTEHAIRQRAAALSIAIVSAALVGLVALTAGTASGDATPADLRPSECEGGVITASLPSYGSGKETATPDELVGRWFKYKSSDRRYAAATRRDEVVSAERRDVKIMGRSGYALALLSYAYADTTGWRLDKLLECDS